MDVSVVAGKSLYLGELYTVVVKAKHICGIVTTFTNKRRVH